MERALYDKLEILMANDDVVRWRHGDAMVSFYHVTLKFK